MLLRKERLIIIVILRRHPRCREGSLLMEKTLQLAMENKDYIVEMRRHFHSHPEVSEHEENTCKRVCEELEKMGLEPKVVCTSGTGVMCDITGKGPGKTIALRADMDALSVQELNDVPYKSTVDGLMHACGHDAHTATLLGAAKILNACREDFNGTDRLLFQPAEETAYGARAMIEAGCLDGVDATMGTHVNSNLKAGTFSVEAGPRLAAANWFKYKFIGKPGHGALPHQGIDAGLAACAAALDLQHLVSREFPADKPLVITVGRIEAGTRFNVIAAEATLEGTVRCFDPEVFKAVPAAMERVMRGVADAYRCELVVERADAITLPCYNPDQASARGKATVLKLFGEDGIGFSPAQMGGEDYSFMMDKVPDSLYVSVGTSNPEKGSAEPHHSGRFNVDEDALPGASAMYAQYAMDYLNE